MSSKLAAAESRTAYRFIVPVLLAMTVTSVVPIVYSVYIAFTNFSASHYLAFDWVGFANFGRIVAGTDRSEFLRVLIWTVVFAALSVGISLLIGHLLALLLNNPRLSGSRVYRTVLILPWALPVTLTALCWSVILNSQFGPLNGVLLRLGFEAIPWLSEPLWARLAVVYVNVWLTYPFMLTVNLGALQGISQEMYEVAEIDGAGATAKWRFVTLPALVATLTPLLVAAFAAHFNAFNVIYLITGGGPALPGGQDAGATDNLLTFTYKTMYYGKNYGRTAAYGILIFLIVGPLTFLNFRLSGALRMQENA